MNLLFVCSGNICRSAMAAAYCRHRAESAGLQDVRIRSAGTLGIEGAPASDEAIEVLGQSGIDLTEHRSTSLDRAEVGAQDIVILMTWDHVEEFAYRFPDYEGERYMLRAFESAPEPDPNPYDLDDPIGKPAPFYREQLQQITRSVDNLVLHLQALPRTEAS